MRFVISVGRGHGSEGGSFALRFGSIRYWVGSTRFISLEVRLEGMVDNNLLLKSGYNIRVFLSSVFRTDYFLDGRRRSMGQPTLHCVTAR